jgi:hypothetical protein
VVISEQQWPGRDGSAHADGDAVLVALVDAVAVLDRLVRSAAEMIDNADAVVVLRQNGRAWTDVLATEEAMRLTAMLAESAAAVGRANSEVRRAAVVALYSTGRSMQAIGQLLGVSRQRVAVVLRAATTRNGQPVVKPSSKQN